MCSPAPHAYTNTCACIHVHVWCNKQQYDRHDNVFSCTARARTHTHTLAIHQHSTVCVHVCACAHVHVCMSTSCISHIKHSHTHTHTHTQGEREREIEREPRPQCPGPSDCAPTRRVWRRLTLFSYPHTFCDRGPAHRVLISTALSDEIKSEEDDYHVNTDLDYDSNDDTSK
jgi:hypothetical protein